MKIFLVGVSCVGKTTIGKHLADWIEYQFIDFDEEIEEYFLMPISKIKAQFFSERSFRTEACKILKQITEQNGDSVVALPPSGLMDSYWRILKKSDSIIIVLKDRPENILDRITFFDEDSTPIHKELTPKERVHCLKDIKRDMTYFGKSYSRAHHTVDIAGLGIEGSVGKIINCLQEKPDILTI